VRHVAHSGAAKFNAAAPEFDRARTKSLAAHRELKSGHLGAIHRSSAYADANRKGQAAATDESRPEFVGLRTSNRANTECQGECRDRRPAASFTSASRPSIRWLMNSSHHDFVTVDMRGLKALLVARAQAERVSVSVLVRGAVAHELGASLEADPRQSDVPSSTRPGAGTVKLSIRMTVEEARRLAAGARSAGLSRGAYLAGLVANVPVLTACGGRPQHIEALMASSAELATLSRNIHRLTALLRQANVEPARPYREMLDTLGDDVRRHLELAARALADLQPSGRRAGDPTH
jgi:hypothetical protein